MSILPKGHLRSVPVPCGRCAPCKLRRVNDWVFRLLQEDKISTSSIFLTLTYDTTHVPISDNGFMSLNKRDYQLFMKRLRKSLPDLKIKYYAVGEYGTKTKRPHYHAILFNCTDAEAISKAWGLGEIHIGTVTSDSIAYTTKYINKPSTIPLHRRDDRIKEFSLMSKNLGDSYLTPAVIAHHQSNPFDLRLQKNQFKIAMPRYYRNKIFDEATKKSQLAHIELTMHQLKLKAEAKHNREHHVLTYDQQISNERFGRAKTFYSSHLQKRDKL